MPDEAFRQYDSSTYARVNRLDPHHPRAVRAAFTSLEGLDVLEVGCGRGLLLQALQAMGANAVGVDANAQAVASGAAPAMKVADAADLPFDDATFDAVVSAHTIEHVPDVEVALREMCRVVRPGGQVLLIYPWEPIRGLWAVPTAVILHRNPFKARQIHRHRLTPERLRARAQGLPLAHRYSTFSWRRMPQYASVFDRVAG